jgi:hypothetical protein
MHRHSPAVLVAAFFLAVIDASSAGCARGGQGWAAGEDTSPSFGAPGEAGAGPCVNLQCRQVTCPEGTTTTLKGTVYDPAGADPIYNAIVYVPNEAVLPFAEGVECDQCGALASGSPVVATLTSATGEFTLNDVPVGDDVPVVVQVGRWRRQTVVSKVTACTDNVMSADATRLPRNQKEGDIPQMAIATGAVDPIECLLRKVGIEDQEFTPPTGHGRIHVYTENGSTLPVTTPAEQLWASVDSLKRYDMVLLPCEGGANFKSAAATQNFIDYTSAGGRVLTSHYGYVWIYGAQAPFPQTAAWNVDQGPLEQPAPAVVSKDFPKGAAFADWLLAVGATDEFGQVALEEARHDVDGVAGNTLAWITAGTTPGPIQHLTFNTPVNAPADQQCGRVLYSDFHVAAGDTVVTEGSEGAIATFPAECAPGALTAQEKIIEFMLFDLASCIQDDTVPPVPPTR